MKVSILMVSYRRDLEFADYSLRSVAKFATGFHGVKVVVPLEDGPMFREIASPLGFEVATFEERPRKGFLHHEAIITEADRWCPEADAILHLDSDCLFIEPVTPADYITEEGKPVLLYQPFEEFLQWTARYGWKQCVRDAIGLDPDNEMMCRHPAVHIRAVYAKTRELIEARHPGTPWLEYILSCRNEFPQTYAEFPTLGAVAREHFYEAYHWARFPRHNDGSRPQLVREKLKAFWSVGGVEMVNDRHPDQTARQVMEQILGE